MEKNLVVVKVLLLKKKFSNVKSLTQLQDLRVSGFLALCYMFCHGFIWVNSDSTEWLPRSFSCSLPKGWLSLDVDWLVLSQSCGLFFSGLAYLLSVWMSPFSIDKCREPVILQFFTPFPWLFHLVQPVSNSFLLYAFPLGQGPTSLKFHLLWKFSRLAIFWKEKIFKTRLWPSSVHLYACPAVVLTSWTHFCLISFPGIILHVPSGCKWIQTRLPATDLGTDSWPGFRWASASLALRLSHSVVLSGLADTPDFADSDSTARLASTGLPSFVGVQSDIIGGTQTTFSFYLNEWCCNFWLQSWQLPAMHQSFSILLQQNALFPLGV